jgi:hypothetical protein
MCIFFTVVCINELCTNTESLHFFILFGRDSVDGILNMWIIPSKYSCYQQCSVEFKFLSSYSSMHIKLNMQTLRVCRDLSRLKSKCVLQFRLLNMPLIIFGILPLFSLAIWYINIFVVGGLYTIRMNYHTIVRLSFKKQYNHLK